MGFFKKLLAPAETSQPRVTWLGSGRRLRSDLALTACISNLEALLLSYRLLQSQYRTAYVTAGWRWIGTQEQPPQTVLAFTDSQNETLFAAFWPEQSGTMFGVFPLGSGDERLSALPIIGHWKQRDPSLSSIGVIPSGQLSLLPPRVPDRFVAELLQTAGFPATPHNVEIIGPMIGKMFLVKAYEFISSEDPRAAERFIQSHQYTGGSIEGYGQGVLDDLATWSSAVLPYIQEIPMRVRAVALEASAVPGTLWSELER